jgi:hypothetical protein
MFCSDSALRQLEALQDTPGVDKDKGEKSSALRNLLKICKLDCKPLIAG